MNRSEVATKIEAFLHHQMTICELVDWCESQMTHVEYEDSEDSEVREVINQIGDDHVRVFGLSWEDCEDMLSRLGYSVEMRLVPME